MNENLSHILGSADDTISPDDVFDALAARQRRRFLVALQRAETPEQVSNLAHSLAAEMEDSDSGCVERTQALLYHWHIPKLAEAGLVSYDEKRNTVRLTRKGKTLGEALNGEQ